MGVIPASRPRPYPLWLGVIAGQGLLLLAGIDSVERSRVGFSLSVTDPLDRFPSPDLPGRLAVAHIKAFLTRSPWRDCP